ncbi:ABC transporter permease [Streptomyces sp. NPDC002491]
MALFILRRAVRSVLLLLVVTFATYFLVSSTPGDAAYTLLGARATPEQLAVARHEMGLDRPMAAQYWSWLTHALHGDLGSSLLSGQPTAQALGQRLAPTVWLLLAAVAVSAVIGVALGLAGALRGGLVGRAIDLVGLAGLAIPNFILGLVLIAVFAVTLRALPASGYVPFADDPGGWARSLVLPVCALAFTVVGILARQLKVSMSDVLEREFIIAMKGNGLPVRSIVLRHGLRNAGLPVVANLGVIVVGLLSGSVLVEAVFGYPGLGSLLVTASGQADLPIVTGAVLVMTIIVIVVNVAVDLFSALIDPRVARS